MSDKHETKYSKSFLKIVLEYLDQDFLRQSHDYQVLSFQTGFRPFQYFDINMCSVKVNCVYEVNEKLD